MAEDAVDANCADDREILTPIGRPVIEKAIAALSPAVSQTHHKIGTASFEK